MTYRIVKKMHWQTKSVIEPAAKKWYVKEERRGNGEEVGGYWYSVL